MSKESFLIYKSFYEPIKDLPNEMLGELFRAIYIYQIEGEEPLPKSIIFMPFQFFKNQFRLDGIKYEKVVNRNKSNGSNGGRPKTEKNPKNPVGFQEPKKPDNDNEKDNVNDKDKEYYRTFKHLQLSFEEFDKLEIDYTKQQIDSVLDSIENYKKNSQYTSLYLTAKKWLGKEYTKKTETSTKIVICR